MARILLSAYACEPGRGSEPALGWGWATELARSGHQVWVLTRADNRPAIERDALAADPDLNFVYFDLPASAQRWRKGLGKILYYVLWQWYAVRHIRKLFPALPFDVVQHVTYASGRYPSFMASLGIPFYFGPVSGGETVPRRIRSSFSVAQRCRECLRDLSNFVVPRDPVMRWVFQRADKLLVTRDTLSLVPPCWRHKCSTQLAIGLTSEYWNHVDVPIARSSNSYRLLYVGRLLEWKGLDLALQAVSQLRQSPSAIRFTIVGDGPARARLHTLAEELGLLGIVEWVRWVPHNMVREYYRAADVFLFPSLRDSGGMAVLEAMAHGLPVVCTDLGGPGVIVNQYCGRVVVTARKCRDQLVSGLVEALREIAATPALHDSLAAGASARARQFKFERLVASLHPPVPLPSATPTT
ncbi:MAG TPA: glycosyltransferase [Terriglobales bacterium]|jgi:glycosyltransferase involved in cell wall biosynthesis